MSSFFDPDAIQRMAVGPDKIAKVCRDSKQHRMQVQTSDDHGLIGIHACQFQGAVYVIRIMTLAQARHLKAKHPEKFPS